MMGLEPKLPGPRPKLKVAAMRSKWVCYGVSEEAAKKAK